MEGRGPRAWSVTADAGGDDDQGGCWLVPDLPEHIRRGPRQEVSVGAVMLRWILFSSESVSWKTITGQLAWPQLRPAVIACNGAAQVRPDGLGHAKMVAARHWHGTNRLFSFCLVT